MCDITINYGLSMTNKISTGLCVLLAQKQAGMQCFIKEKQLDGTEACLADKLLLLDPGLDPKNNNETLAAHKFQ